MTTNIPDQLRADAIALGGAYSRLLNLLDRMGDELNWAVRTALDDIAELFRDALQSRRTIADLKAQHTRDLEALAGDYCPKCGCQIDDHNRDGCTGTREINGDPVDCWCTRTHDDLQSLCKRCADRVDPVEDGAQGGQRKGER